VIRTVSVLTLAAAAISAATGASSARRVTGTVERVIHAQGPCRGGVAVTREELDEVEAKAQHIPLAKTTFTVFAGRRHVGKPVTRFKTDRAARFEVDLPEGVYCVMAGDLKEAAPEDPVRPRAAPTPKAHVDAECLRDLALACDAQLHVRKDSGPRGLKLTLDTFTPCPQPWAQPCYRGPMPP
jgi:hypothetical protein